MKTFEITAAGFDAASDDTDDRVLWVRLEDQSEKYLGQLAGFYGASLAQELHGIDAADIDFTLPGDEKQLRESLSAFSRAESQRKTAERELLVALCRSRPVGRFQIDLEIQQSIGQNNGNIHLFVDSTDNDLYRHDDALVSWMWGCLNTNRNRLLAHVNLVGDVQRDGGGRVSMQIDLGLMPGHIATSASEIPMVDASLDWVSACLNCNTNHVVAKVTLLDLIQREVGVDAPQASETTTAPRARGG